MTEGQPFPPPDAPPQPPPPPPTPDAPPGVGEDSPNPPQPPERRLIATGGRHPSPLLNALRDAAALALDSLDYAADRVAEKIGTARRTETR